MKNVRVDIRGFFNLLGSIFIFIGIVGIISLFFSKTFPLWRILIGICPLIVGFIIKKIVHTVANVIDTTETIIETIQDIKENKNNKDNN